MSANNKRSIFLLSLAVLVSTFMVGIAIKGNGFSLDGIWRGLAVLIVMGLLVGGAPGLVACIMADRSGFSNRPCFITSIAAQFLWIFFFGFFARGEIVVVLGAIAIAANILALSLAYKFPIHHTPTK